MTVRIRLRLGSSSRSGATPGREVASLLASLLTPAAVIALVLCAWRLAADLAWAGAFVFDSGLFSHWQVWVAMAGLLQTCASFLDRYGRGGGEDEATP